MHELSERNYISTWQVFPSPVRIIEAMKQKWEGHVPAITTRRLL